MDVYRPEYCDDMEYEAGKPIDDPEFDASCETGLPNINTYKEGEFTPEHTDESYAAEHTLTSDEEEALHLQGLAAEEARERAEQDKIDQRMMDGEFSG